MTVCSGHQYEIMITCAVALNINTPSPLMCFISNQTVSPTMYKSMLRSSYSEMTVSMSSIRSILNIMTTKITATSVNTSRKSLEAIISIQTNHLFYSPSVEMYSTTSLITSSISVKHTSDIFSSHESSTTAEHSLQLTVYQSSSCVTYTNCGNSNDNNAIELISGLILLSVIMFGLGGVLSGLLTVLWNKKRGGKGRAVVIIYYIFHLKQIDRYRDSHQYENEVSRLVIIIISLLTFQRSICFIETHPLNKMYLQLKTIQLMV